jgi:hypothetical protein
VAIDKKRLKSCRMAQSFFKKLEMPLHVTIRRHPMLGDQLEPLAFRAIQIKL